MNRKTHRCSAAKDEHAIKNVTTDGGGYCYRNGKRCMCHGHCGTCDGAVVMCRMGTFHHVDAYTASFKVYR